MRSWEQLAADAEPFPEQLIEQIEVGGGRVEDYVSWKHYTQRLLATYGPHRYTVTNVTHGRQVTDTRAGARETYVWAVSVRIQLDDDEWYDGVGYADTPAAAESNAYKRACAHAGIGLHLYGQYWLPKSLHKKEDINADTDQ